MLNNRSRHAGVVLLVLSLSSGACTTHRPLASQNPAQGQAIRVAFDAPTTVMLRLSDGDSLRLAQVADLSGPVDSRSGDTLNLRVWNARNARQGDLGVPPGASARVVQGPGIVVTSRVHDAEASKGLAIGVATGAVLAIAAVIYFFYQLSQAST